MPRCWRRCSMSSTDIHAVATRRAGSLYDVAQWSRRFIGLRLFLSLAGAGWDGYARHVERAVDLAARSGRGWRTRLDDRQRLGDGGAVPRAAAGSADITTIVGRVLASGRGLGFGRRFRGPPGHPRLRHAWRDQPRRRRGPGRCAGRRAGYRLRYVCKNRTPRSRSAPARLRPETGRLKPLGASAAGDRDFRRERFSPRSPPKLSRSRSRAICR